MSPFGRSPLHPKWVMSFMDGPCVPEEKTKVIHLTVRVECQPFINSWLVSILLVAGWLVFGKKRDIMPGLMGHSTLKWTSSSIKTSSSRFSDVHMYIIYNLLYVLPTLIYYYRRYESVSLEPQLVDKNPLYSKWLNWFFFIWKRPTTAFKVVSSNHASFSLSTF